MPKSLSLLLRALLLLPLLLVAIAGLASVNRTLLTPLISLLLLKLKRHPIGDPVLVYVADVLHCFTADALGGNLQAGDGHDLF